MKLLSIVGTEVRRTFRSRVSIFFLLVMPMILILLLGLAFGNENARFGVVGGFGGGGSGGLAAELTETLAAQPGLDLRSYDDRASLESAVERGYVSAGVLIPEDYEQHLRSGQRAEILYIARPDSLAQNVRFALESAVAEQGSVIAAAEVVQREQGISFEQALAAARSVEVEPPVTVSLRAADGGEFPEPGSFRESASTQLLLFVFISALNSAIWVIEMRRLGMARRMLSTPTSTRTILSGVVLGRLAVALGQALVIVLFAWLLFGVGWGDPMGVAAVIVSFSLVSVGAGVLLGSIFTREQQAGPVAMLVGLSLAAFGGSMAPLEVFPPLVRKFAHVTPHAWGNDAFEILHGRGGGIGDVMLEVAVLLAFALVLLTVATWRLRRVLTAA